MDVQLNPEQRAFAASAGSLAAELAASWSAGHGPDDVSAPLADDATWGRVVDSGWLAVRVDEELGGAGGSCIDVCVLVEQLARHVLPVPVLGALLVLEQLRLRAAPEALIEAIVGGDRRVAPALTADLVDFADGDRPTDVVAIDAAGAGAAFLLGSAAVEHPLVAVLPTIDLTRPSAVIGASSTPLEVAGRTPQIQARELAFALTLVSADLLGVMSVALERAIAHAKVRQQFGRPIGAFQAVQHLLAEAHVSVEATRSAVWYAGWAVDALPPDDALRAARTAKAFASARGVEVVEAVIQTFGGMGLTWESPAHVWQRRIHLDRRLLGTEAHQYRALRSATGEA
jgi:alkylation response protein AidB-like acyl-CoA dehydrogenase